MIVYLGHLVLACSPAYGQPLVSSSNVGYIDSAIPTTCVRFRFDAAYDDNRPDRAEFFWSGGPAGPPQPETRVDFQEIASYVELAVNNRLSGFVELPVRFLNPEINANATGIGDMNAGVKYAVLADPGQYVTLQLRTYIPTGDASEGLGTSHVSLEPGMLIYKRLTDQLVFEGEFKDWFTVGVTDLAGNILRYGTGLSYEVYRTGNCYVAPVTELVGWTVLSGKGSASVDGITEQTYDAAGETIINVKVGVRVDLGARGDFYVGYGRALTGDVWSKDNFRVEYRWSF